MSDGSTTGGRRSRRRRVSAIVAVGPMLGCAIAGGGAMAGTAVNAPAPAACVAGYAATARRAYDEAASEARTLRLAIVALTEAPDPDRLSAARRAWVQARVAYGRTEAFRFSGGPIDAVDPRTGETGPELRLNAWPVNEAYIDSVAGRADGGLVHDLSVPIDRAALTERNTARDETEVTLGYHAIEFLLWGQDRDPDGPGTRPASELSPADPIGRRRGTYLRVAVDLLVEDLERVAQAWTPGRASSYADRIVDEPPRATIVRALGGMAHFAGFELAMERLAVPLDSGDQEDEQSCFSDTTTGDVVAGVRGLVEVMRGRGEPGEGGRTIGLGECVGAVDPDLEAALDAELRRAAELAAAVPPPFDRLLAQPADSPGRRRVEALIRSLQLVADLMETARARLAATPAPAGDGGAR